MRNGGLKFGLKSFTRGLHANRLLIRLNLSVFLFPGLLGGKFLESVADWRVRTGRVFLAGKSRIIVALKSFFNDVEYKWSVENLQRIQFTCFFDVQLLLGKDRISQMIKFFGIVKVKLPFYIVYDKEIKISCVIYRSVMVIVSLVFIEADYSY